jgi:diaminopimelate epimerase
MFPDSVNVNFLKIIDSQNLALKVYEEGGWYDISLWVWSLC